MGELLLRARPKLGLSPQRDVDEISQSEFRGRGLFRVFGFKPESSYVQLEGDSLTFRRDCGRDDSIKRCGPHRVAALAVLLRPWPEARRSRWGSLRWEHRGRRPGVAASGYSPHERVGAVSAATRRAPLGCSLKESRQLSPQPSPKRSLVEPSIARARTIALASPSPIRNTVPARWLCRGRGHTEATVCGGPASHRLARIPDALSGVHLDEHRRLLRGLCPEGGGLRLRAVAPAGQHCLRGGCPCRVTPRRVAESTGQVSLLARFARAGQQRSLPAARTGAARRAIPSTKIWQACALAPCPTGGR